MTTQQLIDLPGYGQAPKWCRENGYWLGEYTADDIYDFLDYKRFRVFNDSDELVMDYDGTAVPCMNTIHGAFSDAMEAHA